MKEFILIAFLIFVFTGNLIAGPAVPSKSVNAVDFGVVADGKTLCGDALQKAINSITVEGVNSQDGGTVYLPAGIILLDKPIILPAYVMLIGDGASWENTITTFHIKHKDGPAFQVFSFCGIKGVGIFYPDNLTDDKMIKPDVYPPAVELWGCNINLEYIHFDGPWIAVSTAPNGANAGQCLFKNINGFAHHRGFYMSGGMDVNRYENIHWFPSRTNSKFEKDRYFYDNLIAFEFGKQDGFMMNACFIIGGKAFFKQSLYTPKKDEKEISHSLGYSFVNCWIEDVDYGFIFEGISGFSIVGSNILVKENGVGVKVNSECIAYNGVISGTQIRGYGHDKPFVGVEYDRPYNIWPPTELNKLSITDCQIQHGKPAIKLGDTATRVFIKGNLLSGAKGYPALEISEKTDYFTVTDNIFQKINKEQPEPIDNKAGTGSTKIFRDNMFEDL